MKRKTYLVTSLIILMASPLLANNISIDGTVTLTDQNATNDYTHTKFNILGEWEDISPEYGALQGTVTDADDGTPIEGAEIYVIGQLHPSGRYTVYTDENGYYEINPIIAQDYAITRTPPTYKPYTDSITVVPNDTLVYDIELGRGIMDVQSRTVEAAIPANDEQIEIGTLTVSNSGSGNLHWSGEVVFDDIACAVDLSDSLLVIFGQEPTYIPISWLSYAGDFGPDEVPILYIVNTETGALQAVDIETGNVISTIGYPDIEGLTVTGMAYDKSSPEGGMYLSASNGSQSKIYSLDLETGAATEIGMVTGVPSLIDIAIDGEGQMYGYCTETDASYSIDKTTGAATLLGQIGFDASYNQGMSWAPEEDIIYLAAYETTAGGQLRVLDTSTGATTLVGLLPNAAEYDVIAFHIEPEGVGSQEQLPEFTRLEPNFPNPFSHSTTFKFALKDPGHVELAVYNIKGQRVATVLDEEMKAGDYKIQWTPTGGEALLASGIYFYRLEAGDKTFVKKMVIMR